MLLAQIRQICGDGEINLLIKSFTFVLALADLNVLEAGFLEATFLVAAGMTVSGRMERRQRVVCDCVFRKIVEEKKTKIRRAHSQVPILDDKRCE